MAVTREQFAQGMMYDDYKAQMTRNQERFATNERTVALDPATLEQVRSLPRPLDVLVLAEDWCGDVIDNLPILGRIAAESGRLNLRIFLRDQNVELMDQYLNQGQFRSIPVFVFFDQEFREVGRFIERPASVTRRRAERRQAIYAQNPEFGSPDSPVDQLPEETRGRLSAALSEMRAELKPVEVQEVVQAIRDIVRQSAA
jgi:hypothetical protein